MMLVFVVAGAVGALRQRREAVGVAAGRLPRLGPDGDLPDRSALHARLAAWRPPRPRGARRFLAQLLAAPATALGTLAALAGGARPRHEPARDLLLATDVSGPTAVALRSMGADAATLGRVVVCRGSAPSGRLLDHEAHHVRQQERLGPAFAAAYVLSQACWGYRSNPFEVAARRAAAGR